MYGMISLCYLDEAFLFRYFWGELVSYPT